MKIKELLKIYKQLHKKSGCIVITKNKVGAQASIYGDFGIVELTNYTKGFDNIIIKGNYIPVDLRNK